MSSFSWTNGVSGDWNTGTLWTPATVPNDVAADVTIDAATTNTAYTVTIAANETETVHSLMMNGVNERLGTNNPNGYYAAYLALNGTLAFAAGSAGNLSGSLQTVIYTDGGQNAEIVNAGTVDAFIQVSGNLLMTGTNGVYFTNELQALGGTITVDTSSIAEMTGSTLFDGIFIAKGDGAVVNLGGSREGLIVNIATVVGPPLLPGVGWTELSFDYANTAINEWNGSSYVAVESSLNEIAGAGTVDVLDGRNYTTAQSLKIDAGGSGIGSGLFNLQAGVVTTAGLDINGGIVQGSGTIASGVTNDGSLIALGGTNSATLTVTGNLTGTGNVLFDQNTKTGSADPTQGTLVLHGVSAGQTVTMNGGDTLVLATPAAFAGTIAANVGDKIALSGLTATSATLNNGTLVVSNGTATVATLQMSGNYAGDSLTTNGSIVTLGTAVVPTITGATADQAVSDGATINPFLQTVISDANIGQTETVTVTLSAAANGALSNLSGGTYDPNTGVYTTTGTATEVTAALEALVFTPTAQQTTPGQSVTTGFTIGDVDSATKTASNNTTSVIATAGTLVPTITGTVANQAVSDSATISPFAGVAIADGNLGQTETLTVTLSNPANGTLTNLGSGTYDPITGIYTTTGAAAAVTSALDALVFVPTRGEVPGGQTVTSGFTIGVTDTANASTSDATTSVLATAVTPPSGGVILAGSDSQYFIVNNGGTLYVQDTVANRNGAQDFPGVNTMVFANGTGVFDSTGNAENIARLYQTILDRAPDTAGLQAWTTDADSLNVPLSDIANAFIASPEFIQDYGSLSDTDFVTQMYQNGLGRAPDAPGAQLWEGLLGAGVSRGAVALDIADSPEGITDHMATTGDNNTAEVYRLYQTAFGRVPDASGGAFWTAALNAGVSPTDIAQALVQSDEFQSDYGSMSASDFVTALYTNGLHRTPDDAGLQVWTQDLQNGMSQASVIVGFADSLESKTLTAPTTHANWVFMPNPT